mmetsp:Transcript_16582/g.28181  ORF Transcript_16582/g.28181 Transcript_16582/m.28181 type:complete len:100 (-) Transcript_16582:475-774(-)
MIRRGLSIVGRPFRKLRNNVLMSVHLVYHQIVLLAKPAMLTLRARIKMDSSAEQTLLMPVLLVSILAQVGWIQNVLQVFLVMRHKPVRRGGSHLRLRHP